METYCEGQGRPAADRDALQSELWLGGEELRIDLKPKGAGCAQDPLFDPIEDINLEGTVEGVSG